MRILFAGTPQIAVPLLHALVDGEHDVVAVLTREDAPVGRKRVLTPSPVSSAATERGIPVITSNRPDSSVRTSLHELEIDLAVVVAYGALLDDETLAVPGHGWINVHFSALPEWRGAAPVQHTLWSGQRTAAVSVFQLVKAMDAGPVFDVLEVPILDGETAGELLPRLAELSIPITLSVIDSIAEGSAVSTAQTGEPTFAPKPRQEDGRVPWSDSATAIDARLRGLTPEPGCFTELAGARLKILKAHHRPENLDTAQPGLARAVPDGVAVQTGEGTVVLTTVQPAGKTPMSALDWWRGVKTEEVRFD